MRARPRRRRQQRRISCRYLAEAILPWYDEQRTALEAAPKVRLQALGEALDPDRLERLGQYEVHIDR